MRLEITETAFATYYKLNDEYHRANGPAAIWKNVGEWEWYMHGESHRYYGRTFSYGRETWMIHGEIVYDRKN